MDSWSLITVMSLQSEFRGFLVVSFHLSYKQSDGDREDGGASLQRPSPILRRPVLPSYLLLPILGALVASGNMSPQCPLLISFSASLFPWGPFRINSSHGIFVLGLFSL